MCPDWCKFTPGGSAVRTVPDAVRNTLISRTFRQGPHSGPYKSGVQPPLWAHEPRAFSLPVRGRKKISSERHRVTARSMGSGSGLQDVPFHSGLGLPGVTGREGSGSTSLKGHDVPGTGALAAKIGPIPLGSRRDGQARSTGELSSQMPNGIPAQRADERAGDLMAKLDGQGGGQRNPNGRDVEGNLPGMALDRPWLGGDRLGVAWEGAATTSLGTDRGPPSTHPTITSLNRSIPTSASLVGPTLCLLSSPRSVILISSAGGTGMTSPSSCSTLREMGRSMGGLPGGLNPETILIRSPMPSDAEAIAPALVPDVAGPTIRSKGDGRPTKSPPRPRINPEGTCCAVNVVGCGGAEAAAMSSAAAWPRPPACRRLRRGRGRRRCRRLRRGRGRRRCRRLRRGRGRRRCGCRCGGGAILRRWRRLGGAGEA